MKGQHLDPHSACFCLTSRCFSHPAYFMSNETGLNDHKQCEGRGWVRGRRGVNRLREGHVRFLLFTLPADVVFA